MSSLVQQDTDQKADHAAVTAIDVGDGTRRNKKKEKRTSTTTTPSDQQQQQQQQQQQHPLTEEGERPQKKFYRQRAHCNPLSHNDAFTYPRRPDLMDWTVEHYPAAAVAAAAAAAATAEQQRNNKNYTTEIIVPTILDIGCGFGGLTMALGRLLSSSAPEDDDDDPTAQVYILGMEIRAKVTEYVRLRILAARNKNTNNNTNNNNTDANQDEVDNKEDDGNDKSLSLYQNCSVLRTNSMKFLPNYFDRATIDKMFFCFPDPHFKRKNHPRRIISDRLLSEYAFLLKPGTGKLYCITDVPELHQWHIAKCNAHPLFQRIPADQAEQDPCVQAMKTETEEGKKVEREGREKYYAVYRRIPDSQAMVVNSSNFFA